MRRQGSPVHSPVELGHVVRVRREELAFSLAQVAGLTGVDSIVIDSLERGDGAIVLQTAMLVCSSSAWRSWSGRSTRTNPKTASTRCSACASSTASR
jgi:hypothetical protein